MQRSVSLIKSIHPLLLTHLRRLAYSEMRLIISRLIYNFDFELCVESRNWIDQKAFFVWEREALMVRLSERDSCKHPLTTSDEKQE